MSPSAHTAEVPRALFPRAASAASSPAAAASPAVAAVGENECGEVSEDALCLPAYRHPRGTPKKRPWGAPAFKPRFKEAWDPISAFAVGTPRFRAKDRDVTTTDTKPQDAAVSPVSSWFESLSGAAEVAAHESCTVNPIRPPAVPLPAWPPPDQTLATAATAAKRQQKLRHASAAAVRYPLEPLHALDEEIFLRGPREGRGPLSHEERLHLRKVGLDFKEEPSADLQRVFGGEERERWRRSKVLRARLKNKQVVFRRDVLASEFEADFARYTGRPHKAGASYGIGSQEARMQGDEAAEAYRAALPWSYYFEKEAEGDRQQQPAEELPPPRPEHVHAEMREEDQRLHYSLLLASLLLALVLLMLLLLLSLLLLCALRRKKHPKDRVVLFSRLRGYGERIEEATSCGKLKDEVASLLRQGWRPAFAAAAAAAAATRVADVPKGIRRNPNYDLTKEKLAKAAAKIRASRGEAAEADDVQLAAGRRRRGPLEEASRVLAGRYAM
ncbi:hypothetical protein Esti_005476 [Eimeria stiedai]